MAETQNMAKMAAGKAVNPMAKIGMAKDFLKHWHILGVAAIFDIIGMIPYLCLVTNLFFFCILWMYFGSKSKESQFMSLVVPAAFVGISDAFLGILPACLAATVIRILLKWFKIYDLRFTI